jgi:hypothetical protein
MLPQEDLDVLSAGRCPACNCRGFVRRFTTANGGTCRG